MSVATLPFESLPAPTPTSAPGARGVPTRRPLDREARFRRRRMVALLVVIGLVFVAVAGVRLMADAVQHNLIADSATSVAILESSTQTIHVVQPGDTLYGIAREVSPGGDVEAVVTHLADLNGGAEIAVGQRLHLVAQENLALPGE